MERTAWTDERLDDAFTHLRGEMRELRQDFREFRGEVHSELSQMKLFMLGGLITILAAFIGLHG